ncbi:LysM peptidoglycan-binding domain-containing protein [Weissella soli]|uniref:LysM domain-containing protein n=1 Tax=Weissella soli TaxID=155866 RepID=A0A288QU47_9LACO|nr:LysM domain-containing protein [Weissella soli]AOT56618.1 Putative hydrolase [Weissella soli]NKY83072.1 LysM peptidoglycan-binding domain-containing protein [Weissella soli]RDL12181.1 LysM domain-containing protein [Weissella soli]GEN92574.1 peptidoglycan-binding protein [Weissella soli]
MKNAKLILSSVVTLATMGMTAGVANADTYSVKSGDTLSEIAETNNTTIEKLAALNGITNVNFLSIGQEIEVSADASTAESAAVTTTATSEATTTTSEATTTVATATTTSTTSSATTTSGSVYDQFIAAGGTDAMWTAIVMPESGGNPDAVSANGYRGLGQTKEAWGTGSVATQTAGMINYAVSRYGSIENAISFRQANGWW